MPAAVVAVASYAASSFVSAAVGGGIIGAIVGGAASYAVSTVLGGVLGNNTQAPDQQQEQATASPVAQAERGVLVNTASTVDPLPVIYGKRRLGGTRVFTETSGSSNTYLHVIIAHAEGECASFEALYFDNLISTDARFSGQFTAEHYVGTDAQAASAALIAALPAKWTSAHKLSGVAYTYVKLTYNANAWHGIPVIAVDLKGRKVYDPRNASTAWSDNPALCLRDYLTNTRYGRGIDEADIDDDTFSAAANYCDALVSVPDGNGGTTTQKRYTCNAILDTGRPAIGNVKRLLTCMRGMLVFSGGLYKLVLDKADTPTFTFDEDNIVGAWSIKLGDKRSRYNRVRGEWISPTNEWQPDIATAESTAYRTLDNGLMLESQLDLPCTTNAYEAQMLAQRHLKQSRFGTLCSFRATVAGLLCEVGDVVNITHSTPGWTDKPFRVARIALLSSDEVEVTAVEYDDAVYDVDPLTEPRTSTTTNLPDPYTVPAPGAPTVTEALYQTTGSAGVKNSATLSWTAVDDAFVLDYLPEYRIAGGTWVALPPVIGTSIELLDVAPGTYEARLRARNALGVTSNYSPTRTKEIVGLTAPPPTPANFSLFASGGVYMAQWDRCTDLDVRIGGRVVIRHSSLTSGATWNNGIIVQEFNGDAVTGLVPLMAGSYMAKFVDSSDNWSTVEAVFVPSEALLTGYSTVATSTQHPTFSGTKTNTIASGGELSLAGTANIDDMTDSIDDWIEIDYIGGVELTGSYAFDATMDCTTVASRRVETAITAELFALGDLIDARVTNIDAWSDIDGTAVNDADATMYIRTTPDDPAGSPTWSAWLPFFVGDFDFRAAQFRLDLETADPSHNIKVTELTVRARIPA